MTDKAKFRYSAQEGVLELEGSEEFVSQHFESLTDLIRIISRHVVIEQKQEPSTSTLPTQNTSTTTISLDNSTPTPTPGVATISETGIAKHPTFFSEINGKLKIVADIPGANARAKMTNAAILYCYGSKLLGDEQVSNKEIRTVCEEHGILDSANFSKIFSDKTLFISDGIKGGNKDVKLTFQGEKKARELVGNAES